MVPLIPLKAGMDMEIVWLAYAKSARIALLGRPPCTLDGSAVSPLQLHPTLNPSPSRREIWRTPKRPTCICIRGIDLRGTRWFKTRYVALKNEACPISRQRHFSQLNPAWGADPIAPPQQIGVPLVAGKTKTERAAAASDNPPLLLSSPLAIYPVYPSINRVGQKMEPFYHGLEGRG